MLIADHHHAYEKIKELSDDIEDIDIEEMVFSWMTHTGGAHARARARARARATHAYDKAR